jgi:hypothetical protein
MPQAIPINITPSADSHESVTDLIALHHKINRFLDSAPVMPDSVCNGLVTAASDLRFEIAKTPALSLKDVAAKAMLILNDQVEVGSCEKLAMAMRDGIRADLERLEVSI